MKRSSLRRVKKRLVAIVTGRRLRDVGQKRMSRRMYVIRQMTPSEIEYAEDKYRKPIDKFTIAELEREFKAIKETYPAEEW